MACRRLPTSLVAGLGPTLWSPPADARPLRGEFASSIVSTGVDPDGDFVFSSHTTARINSNLGKFLGQSVLELDPWDGTSFCTDGPAGTTRRTIRESTEIWTHEDLSQIHFVLSPDAPSFVCVRPLGGFYGRGRAVVMRGTGNFTGVTGTVTSVFVGESLPSATGHTAARGTVRGNLR